MTTQTKTTWRKVKLGEIASTVTDFVANGSFASLREHVKYHREPEYAVLVRTKDLQDDFSGELVYVDKEAYEFLGKSRLFGGEIILSNVGNVGSVFRCPKLDRPMTLGPNAIILKTKEDDGFYYYYFKSPAGQHKIDSLISGSSQPKFNKTHFRALEIEVPDKTTQKHIAEILSAFDDKIELNNKISRTLEKMAQAVFKEWFVNFRFSGHEKIKMVDSELGQIPEGWEIKKIKDVAKIQKGISYSSTEISDKSKGHPMLNLANFLRGGGFNPTGVKYYSGKYKESDLVQSGDIIIAMTDLTSNREVIGHPARVPMYSHWDKILISLDVCVVKTEEILRSFLYYLMLRKDFSFRMASSAGGTNVAHLSKSAIEDFTFVLPSRDLLEKFHDFVSPVVIARNKTEVENKKLAELRDLLLPKLMSGEIRV